MATIGQQYTTPEAGWQRIDEVNPYIKYVGIWNVENLSANYGGTAKYTSDINARVFFNFNGTKLRIIGGLYDGRTTKAEVYIDGVLKGTINEATASGIAQVLVFEATGLSSGKHQVEIRMVENKALLIDAIEIDSTGSMAGGLIGVPLTAPEEGWKRYGGYIPQLSLIGSWEYATATPAPNYKNDVYRTTTSGDMIKFKFKGSKIRLITNTNYTHTKNAEITIDGVTETFSDWSSTQIAQVLIYEKIGMVDTIHEVIIKHNGSNGEYLVVDAIDIDSTGRLLHPDEVLDPKDLSVGKRIRCHYQASSGQVGTFSGLGQETSDFIPPASSATPNGDFYFIMVEDWNGKKKLIADRNIQHSISWDTLNNVGIASGSGLPLDYVADFNGNNCFVEDRSDLQITGDLTANIKFLLRSYPPSSSYKYIFQCGANGESEATNVLYGLMIQPDGTLSIAHEYGTSASNIIINTPYKIPLNTIVDITVSRNSTLKKYTLFVNDIYQGEFSYSNNPTKATSGPLQKLYIGADTTANSSSLNYTNMILYNFSLDTTFIDNLSYDEYKQTKYDEGKLYNLNPLSTKNISATIRLLTGGVQSGDTQNEWDKYIVNSTLNGTITAGDNNVWNWKNMWSLTSTSPIIGSTDGNGTGSNTSSERVQRGANPVNYWWANPSNGVYSDLGFRPVLLIEKLKKEKILFRINDEWKKWDHIASSWVTVTTTPPTEDDFLNNGMDSLDGITSAELALLGDIDGVITIEMYTDDAIATSKNLNLTAIPLDKLVIPTGDINISHVSNIDSFTLNATVAGNGVIKTVISFDRGKTWYAWDAAASQWVQVPLTTADVREKGMTPDVLNSITSENWNNLRGTSDTVRFAYLLSMESSTDVAEIDSLFSQFDMIGSWKHYKDADYEYRSNTLLQVKVYDNGDYKINY